MASTAARPESNRQSLIDDLLELRDNPFPREEHLLMEMLGDVTRSGPLWQVHFGAVDTALDILVPNLQAIKYLSPDQGVHQYCLPRVDVDAIIGRVPRRVTGRYVRD